MMTSSAASEGLQPARIVEAEPMRFTGLAGDYTPETMPDIGRVLWPRFIQQLQGARLSGVGGMVSWGAGFHCFDGSPSFQYACLVQVSEFTGAPAGWLQLDVPRRRYAIFTHRDHVSRLGDTINAIQQRWLPGSGHVAAHGGGTPDFLERYGEAFDPGSGTGDLEVWFPIRP